MPCESSFRASAGEMHRHGGATMRSVLRGVRAGWRAPGHGQPIRHVMLHCPYERCYLRHVLEGRPTRGAFPRQGNAFPHSTSWPALPQPASELSWQKDQEVLWVDPLDARANKRLTCMDLLREDLHA